VRVLKDGCIECMRRKKEVKKEKRSYVIVEKTIVSYGTKVDGVH